MTTFVLATANPDKAREIVGLLGEEAPSLELVARPPEVPDVDEVGETLEDNARIKAVALCAATSLPAVADDTGLHVDALGGAPGVHTARYAGEDATYADNVKKLLGELDALPLEQRAARFATVAVARWPDGLEVAALGEVEGVITSTARGDGGFGYDPVFVPLEGDGRTFAEMTRRGEERVLTPCPCVPHARQGGTRHPGNRRTLAMAVIDIAGFVADLKDHAVEHGFHVHDERHFVESYSLRQTWEVDMHPEEGCEGPVDLYLSLEVDPRVLLGFEDAVMGRPENDDPPDDFHFPVNFTWALPPLPHGPDLLLLATELAGRGGPDLPLEVSAIDSIPAATDVPERSLRIVAHQRVSLLHIRDGDAVSCDVLEHCLAVSRYLLEGAPDWLS